MEVKVIIIVMIWWNYDFAQETLKLPVSKSVIRLCHDPWDNKINFRVVGFDVCGRVDGFKRFGGTRHIRLQSSSEIPSKFL